MTYISYCSKVQSFYFVWVNFVGSCFSIYIQETRIPYTSNETFFKSPRKLEKFEYYTTLKILKVGILGFLFRQDFWFNLEYLNLLHIPFISRNMSLHLFKYKIKSHFLQKKSFLSIMVKFYLQSLHNKSSI